jgi:signal transduction histidine kinase
MQERALRLGGRVEVSGTPGKGTRVMLALPHGGAAA